MDWSTPRVGSEHSGTSTSPRGKNCVLDSPIDFFERDPRLVATDDGITALGRRARGSVIAALSSEHRAAAPRRLIVAVWPDGRAVASGDPMLGGPPTREGRIDAARLARYRENVASAAANAWRTSCMVLDPACRLRILSTRGTVRPLRPVVEPFELDPRLVATDDGISALDGREREAVIAPRSPEHRALRAVWAECVAAIGELAREATFPLGEVEPVRDVWRSP